MSLEILAVDYPTPGYMTPRDEKSVTDFIIHHSAGSLEQTALDVDAEHRNIGDAMIAYNWIITPDGKVYAGRPTQYVPAAAYGDNDKSVDVCLIGQFQPGAAGYTGEPTDAQLTSLLELANYVHKTFSAISRTIGHRDVAAMYPMNEAEYATACPGDNLYNKIPDLKRKISQ